METTENRRSVIAQGYTFRLRHLIVGWKIAKLIKRRLRIAFPPLISKLAYAAPEIHNLCRHVENRRGTCLSMLDDRGDFRATR
jgi:hypothetical protein